MFAAAAHKAEKCGHMTIKEAVLYGMRFADGNPRPDMVAIADVRRALDIAIYEAGLADTNTCLKLDYVFGCELAKSRNNEQLSLF